MCEYQIMQENQKSVKIQYHDFWQASFREWKKADRQFCFELFFCPNYAVEALHA